MWLSVVEYLRVEISAPPPLLLLLQTALLLPLVYPLLQLKVIQLIQLLVAIAVPNTAAEGGPTDQAARRARTYASEGHSR